LVILDAETAVQALRQQPANRTVIKNGRVLTERKAETIWH